MAISPVTSLLLAHLKRCHADNQLATFEEMNEIVHINLQVKRHYLMSALEIALRDHGLVFQSITHKGYQPIPPEHIPEHATLKRQSAIKGQTRKWRQEFEQVNPAGLSDEEYKDWLKCGLKLSVQETINNHETQKKIGFQVQSADVIRRSQDDALEMTRRAFSVLRDCC